MKNCKNCLHSECGNYKKDKNTYCYQFLTAKIHLDLMDKNTMLHNRIIELESKYEPKRYVVSSHKMPEDGRTKWVILDMEKNSLRVVEMLECDGINVEAIIREMCDHRNEVDRSAKSL